MRSAAYVFCLSEGNVEATKISRLLAECQTMPDVIAAEALDEEEGDSMVIHMHPESIDAIKMNSGDYCRLSTMGATSFYGKITASPRATAGCVHINDIAMMCLLAAEGDTLQISSIPLMRAETLEVCCVGGEMPPGGGDALSESFQSYFEGSASRIVGLHQIFQLGSEEFYFKVVSLSAKPYNQSDIGDGTYGTVTLDPALEHKCKLVIKTSSNVIQCSNLSAVSEKLKKVRSGLRAYASLATRGQHNGQKTEVDGTIEKFRAWDIDGNGRVSKQEMAVVLDSFCPGEFTQADIESMAARADLNRDGQIDIHEFISWILK